VSDDEVERSNRILARLRAVATSVPGARAELAALPMHRVAQVGDLRIGIVHGDAWSLAGWQFAHDRLHDAAQAAKIAQALELGAVDGYACSHTCAPAAGVFGERFVVNNGAAGMANFAGTTAGLLTRVSVRPLSPRIAHRRVYGLYERGVWIDAVSIDFDLDDWLARFDAIWPPDSAAAASYRRRLTEGPFHTVAQALGRAAAVCGAPSA
jgi:hypothetical protein